MNGVGVSVVAPLYNEAAILPELARRCADAAAALGAPFEVLLVDDASTDQTRIVASGCDPRVTFVHLPQNLGQLGATREGVRRARGEIVVVLDGDLQDPPEVIGPLVQALRAAPHADVCFAVKTQRDDPAWFLAGRALYGALTAIPGARLVPSGAGAFCAMRRAVATRVGATTLPRANLAPLLVALGAAPTTHPYAKAARYDGASRVGALGLIAEGLASLALTGALGASLRVLAAAFAVVALFTWAWPWALVAGAVYAAAAWTDDRARRALAPEAPDDLS